MQTIDVQGLPEPIVKALQRLVDTLRTEITTPKPVEKATQKVSLPQWSGKPIGNMSRSEIYEELLSLKFPDHPGTRDGASS